MYAHLISLRKWHISRLDVCTAYLYGILEEELCMEFPEEFLSPEYKDKKLFMLLCTLDSLKQAGLT